MQCIFYVPINVINSIEMSNRQINDGNKSFCFPISQEDIFHSNLQVINSNMSGNNNFIESNQPRIETSLNNKSTMQQCDEEKTINNHINLSEINNEKRKRQLESTVTIKTTKTEEESNYQLSQNNNYIQCPGSINDTASSSNSVIKLRLADFDVIDGTIAIPLELLTNLNFVESVNGNNRNNQIKKNEQGLHVSTGNCSPDKFWADNVFSLPFECFDTKNVNDSTETHLEAVRCSPQKELSKNAPNLENLKVIIIKPAQNAVEIIDSEDKEIEPNQWQLLPQEERNQINTQSSDIIESRSQRKRHFEETNRNFSNLKELISCKSPAPIRKDAQLPSTSTESNLFSSNEIQNNLPSSHSDQNIVLPSESSSNTSPSSTEPKSKKDPKLRRKKYENSWPNKTLEEKVSQKFVQKFKINIFEDPVDSLLKINYESTTNKFHYPRHTLEELTEKLHNTEELGTLVENAIDESIIDLIKSSPEKLYRTNPITKNNNSDSDSTDDNEEQETHQFLIEAKYDAEIKMKQLYTIFDNQRTINDSSGELNDYLHETKSDDEDIIMDNDNEKEDKLITIFRNWKKSKIHNK